MLDSKGHDLSSKADNHIKPYIHLESMRSISEVKSDVQSSSKEENKLQSGVHNCQSETMKRHSLPKMAESRSQSELLPTTSDTIIPEPMQYVKPCKDNIMVKIQYSCFFFKKNILNN